MSRSLTGFAMVIALISLPFLAWGAWEEWFERDNREIASDLPVYPEARLIRESESLGSLDLTFQLPRGTSPAEVEAFYRERLGADWRLPGLECPGFRQGDELLLMRVYSPDYRTLGMLINNEAADDCDEYSWFVYS